LPFKVAEVTTYAGGLGCFATRPIAFGELILREAPVLVADDDDASGRQLEAAVARLTPEARDAVFSLVDSQEQEQGGGDGSNAKTAAGIVRSNAYPTEEGQGGLFPVFARFNHSCTPNVSHRWNGDVGQRLVFATRAVQAGEELLNNYVPTTMATAARQSSLREKFGFDCSCSACTQPSQESSDACRVRAAELDEAAYRHISRGRYKEGIAAVEEHIALLEQEGLASPAALVRACYDGYQACAHGGDNKGALAWLTKVYGYTKQSDLEGSAGLKELEAAMRQLSEDNDDDDES
jgi:hypothetical protein